MRAQLVDLLERVRVQPGFAGIGLFALVAVKVSRPQARTMSAAARSRHQKNSGCLGGITISGRDMPRSGALTSL